MEINEMKKLVAQAVRTLAGGEILTLTVGHVSCRIPDKNQFVMLGHAHKAFKTLDTITEDDIITVDFDGNVIEGKYEPPGEVYIHTEIYKKRDDLASVIHGHPLTSMAFGIAYKKLVPVYHRAAQFYPEVPIYDFWGQINTPELGQKTANALGHGLAVVLRGHGIVVVGNSVEDATVNAFALERNAQVQYMAAALGTPNPSPLEPSQKRKKKPTSVWSYFVKRYDPMFSV